MYIFHVLSFYNVFFFFGGGQGTCLSAKFLEGSINQNFHNIAGHIPHKFTKSFLNILLALFMNSIIDQFSMVLTT